MPETYIERILRARVYDVAIESPLTRAERLSRRLGNQVFLKREDLQPVFSFKLRGAYNKLIHLDEETRRRGVVTASAGNHAQGVALGAERLKIEAIIVMPRTTPTIKVQAVRSLGGKAVLHGDSYDEAYAHALALAAERGLAFIHPFDDPDVIAGQGTIGMEILRQHPRPPDAIFVPVGGGGLIAGVAAYVKYVQPRGPDHRGRAGGGPDSGAGPGGGEAGGAGAGRALRRRRGGAPDRGGDLPRRPAPGGRGGPGQHRRDLRRHQGHLRRHPRHRRARRGPGGGRTQALRGAGRGSPGPT